MKKIQILLAAIILMAMSIKSDAQPYYWSGSGTLTTTTGNCSIGGGLLDLTIPGATTTWSTIQAGTANAGLSIFTQTGPSDGPLLALHGISCGPVSGEWRNGSIYYSSITNPDADYNNVGHRFLNYNATGSFQTNMEIGKDGRTIIGPGVDYSFIAAGDNLTVRDQIGLFPSSTSAGNVNINGNTTYGSLSLHANTNTTYGGSISLWGSSIGGKIQYNASIGSSGIAHEFMSFDGTSNHDNFIIGYDGRSIIGQDMLLSYIAPGDVLTVRDQIGLFPSLTSAAVVKINGNTNSGAFLLNAYTSQSNGASIGMYGWPGGGEIRYSSFDYGGGTGKGHEFFSTDGKTSTSHMTIYNSGKVAIGPDLMTWPPSSGPDLVHPDGYLLYVEKGILTEKLKVAMSSDATNWSDFVFNKNYDLMPLNEVASFVKKNKHLPEIPSASEVAKEGIDVATMDAKLLQKIEELTLYVIQQQKEIDELKKKANE